MKKVIFGFMTLLALVAFSTNSYAGENNDTSEKCGQGKCGGDKKPVQKCGAGKCGGGK